MINGEVLCNNIFCDIAWTVEIVSWRIHYCFLLRFSCWSDGCVNIFTVKGPSGGVKISNEGCEKFFRISIRFSRFRSIFSPNR